MYSIHGKFNQELKFSEWIIRWAQVAANVFDALRRSCTRQNLLHVSYTQDNTAIDIFVKENVKYSLQINVCIVQMLDTDAADLGNLQVNASMILANVFKNELTPYNTLTASQWQQSSIDSSLHQLTQEV